MFVISSLFVFFLVRFIILEMHFIVFLLLQVKIQVFIFVS